MAAQKGLDMLIKIPVSGTVTTVAGLRSTSITMSDESVDITNKSDLGVRKLLAGGGVNSIAISGSGVFTDLPAELAVRTAFEAQKSVAVNGTTPQAGAFTSFTFVIPNLGKYVGLFQVTSLEYAGEYNGEVTYSMSFESAGFAAFTAA